MFFGWDAEREDAFVVGVGEAEIAKADDVHANDDVIVLEITFHHLAIGHDIACWYQNMNQIGVRVACSSNTRNAALLVRLKAKLTKNSSLLITTGTIVLCLPFVWRITRKDDFLAAAGRVSFSISMLPFLSITFMLLCFEI